MNCSLNRHPDRYRIMSTDCYEMLLGGCSASVYARRHLTMNHTEPSCGHSVLACLEFMPVIGFVSALTERICVYVGSFLHHEAPPFSATARRFHHEVVEPISEGEGLSPIGDNETVGLIHEEEASLQPRGVASGAEVMEVDLIPSPVLEIREIPPALAKMFKNLRKAVEERKEHPYCIQPEELQSFRLPAGKVVERVIISAHGECGEYRPRMEDAHFILSMQEGLLAGVFDGHGGASVARHASLQVQSLFSTFLNRLLTQNRDVLIYSKYKCPNSP
ncbi:MAG: hypothetical protein JSR97_04775 [Verrucomicrobia bacterium]|nr:hypothetical protein [Verrucomicrobiota bacterium]